MTTEDLYKNSFDGFQQDPPPGVWKGVNRRLAIKSFLKPGLGHFNILYVAAEGPYFYRSYYPWQLLHLLCVYFSLGAWP